MAQIIKHRRGSLEALSSVTSSLQKGEIVIASGSSNLSVTNGSSIVFAVPENGVVQATNRFLIGENAPNSFAGSTYNGMVKGVPYYASGSSTLYLLGTDGNDAISLIGNIQPFSTSVDSRLDDIETSLGGGGGIGTRVSNLESHSVFINAFSASTNLFTQSVNSHITDINLKTASFESEFASLSAYTASTNIVIAGLNSFTESFSQSVATDFSASNARESELSTSVDSRLDLIETTYATTGSNTFNANQIISGNVWITGSLVVYGSSSLQNVTASAVDIGTNTIILNTAAPAVRYAGISVRDSGSAAGTGSLWWDSVNNHWLYEHPADSGAPYNSAILIAGPKNTGALGEEVGLSNGYIPVATGDDHIDNSIMSQSGGNLITIGGGLNVIGEISSSTINGIGNVTTFSTSVDSRLSGLALVTGSYATTGSNTFVGKQSISSSLEIGDSATVFKIEGNAFSQTYLTANGAIVLNPGLGGVEMVGSYRTFKATDITAEGNLIVSGSTTLGDNSADNTIISGSLRTHDIAYIGDSNTLFGNALIVSGGVDINNESMYPVSIKNNLVVSGSTTLGTDSTDSIEISGSLRTKERVTIGSSTTQFGTALEVTGAVDINNESMYPVSIKNNLVVSGSTYLGTDSTDSIEISGSLKTKEKVVIGSSTTQFGTALEITGAVEINNESMYPVSVKNNLNVTGSISASSLIATTGIYGNIYSTNGVVSGSSQIDLTQTNGYSTFSTSVDSRLDTLEGTGTIQGVGTTNDVTFNKVTTAGDVIVGGDLVVQGNTVSLNASTLTIEDKLITLASGSLSNLTADGAGFEIDGTTAKLTYNGTTNEFSSSVPIAANVTGSINIPGAGSSKRLAFRTAVGNIDFVTAPSNVGDIAQWDGTDFVMSNVIDGGTY